MRLFLSEFLCGYKRGVQALIFFFFVKSQLLHLPEQDLYGAWAKGFPFLLFSFITKGHAWISWGFIPFHFTSLFLSPSLPASLPAQQKGKNERCARMTEKRICIILFLSFLNNPIRTLQHALSQTDTDTKSTQVQTCHTLLITDRLQPWISCFHAI